MRSEKNAQHGNLKKKIYAGLLTEQFIMEMLARTWQKK
jgi:hypothetical protein